MTMVGLILIPVIFGVILYKVPPKFGKVLLMLVQLYLSIHAIYLFLKSKAGEPLFEILGGEDHVLYIGLRGDRIALVFACLTVFLFTVTFIYSLNDTFFDNKFMLLFLILEGLLIGIFLSDDLFNLFILMEVATIVVSILIMLKKEGRAVFDGLFYLITQIISMMFFLFGIAYIYKIFGVLSIEEIINIMMSVDVPSETLILPFSLLMTGICIKCGFFPLFNWLPRAHGTPSAPPAVSAILSGLFVKCGLFLFIRLNDLFYPVLDFSRFFLIIAIITGIIGFSKALAQKDMKLILAYSTVSQVGLIAVGLTSSNDVAFWGSIYHILNHAVFKSLLFLIVGMIMKEYNTRNIYEVRGLWKRMPLVATATLLAVLGITGAPLFNGSMSKYWILAGHGGSVVEAAIWIINTGTMLTFVKFSTILFGKSDKKATADRLKTGVSLFLGIICFLGGIFSSQIVQYLFDVNLSFSVSDYLFKGLLYVVTLVGCIIFYRFVVSKSKLLPALGQRSQTLPRSNFVLLLYFLSMVVYGIIF